MGIMEKKMEPTIIGFYWGYMGIICPEVLVGSY